MGLSVAERRLTPKQRFWSQVDKRSENECWNWTGFRNHAGYGYIRMGKRRWLAHRLSWTWVHGEIPEGLCALHKCDNRTCVNPNHLFLGTRTDNVEDMDKKGRRRVGHGEKQHKSKLRRKDIPEIFRLRAVGLSQQAIADRFGVHQQTIGRVLLGKTWKHVTQPNPNDYSRQEQPA